MTGWNQRVGAVVLCLVFSTAATGDTVLITLKPSAAAPEQQVRVEDVAALEGGTLALRHRIARFDLAELPAEGSPFTITREQLAFRLQLAGIEPERFEMRGAARTLVTPARCEISEEDILAAAEEHLRQRLPASAGEATMRVTRSLAAPVIVNAARGDVRLAAECRAAGLPLGSVQVEVGVYVQGIKRRAVTIHFHVKMQQQVAVAGRPVERGEVLSAANVTYEQRTVESLNQFVTAAESLLGKKAKQPLHAGQVLTLRDVEVEAPANTVLIKQRDRVRLVARLGNDYLTATGEAMQDGREGQLIQVRNTESKKTVVGRVVARGLVEVDY